MSAIFRRCNLSLYLVANRQSFPNETQFFTQILSAVRGGVSCVQLRDFGRDFTATLSTAVQLRERLQNIPLFINTPHLIEVAQECRADGVYLEEPFPAEEARRRLGEKRIIGMPVKCWQDVVIAEASTSIDYLSVKIAPSKKTCPKNESIWGMEGLRGVCAYSSHRIVAIGGIELANAESVYRELRRGDGIALAGGLMRQENPYLTARKIRGMQL